MEPHCICCDNTMALPPGQGVHNCHFYGLKTGFYAASPDPYTTLGQQLRAELDREAEAVAYLQARGYKVIKKEGV